MDEQVKDGHTFIMNIMYTMYVVGVTHLYKRPIFHDSLVFFLGNSFTSSFLLLGVNVQELMHCNLHKQLLRNHTYTTFKTQQVWSHVVCSKDSACGGKSKVCQKCMQCAVFNLYANNYLQWSGKMLPK